MSLKQDKNKKQKQQISNDCPNDESNDSNEHQYQNIPQRVSAMSSHVNLQTMQDALANINVTEKNQQIIHSIRNVASVQSFIKEKYSDTKVLETSLLGQVLVGTIKDSKCKTEVIKLCFKDRKRQLSNRVAEDSRSEIEFMHSICNYNHPHFVGFIEAIEDNKLYCIRMEYVIGCDMCTYIQNLGTGLGNNRAKKYFIQLTKAVYFMHKMGFCHLDLSLENVLLDKRNDIVKICDFGLSRRYDINEYFPPSTVRPGKKGYMAPEIYSYRQFNGEKADVFSLGVIIFILLTGFPPFSTPNARDKCFQFIYYGKLEWLFKKWNLNDIISCECRDLLSKIFCPSKTRIRIREMLQHPYLNQNTDDIDQEILQYSNSMIGKVNEQGIDKTKNQDVP
eukprot:415950_1